MLPTGLDFLRSFFAILLVRAVPVPIYPPLRLDRLEEYAARQSAILADAGVALLVTIARARPVAALLRPAVKTLQDVVTPDELARPGTPFGLPDAEAADPAFIQYTSGSTGQPKGVLLTHANLLANIRAIAAGLELRPTDVGVSWLPLYHDMGLIGSWLFCLHNGMPLDAACRRRPSWRGPSAGCGRSTSGAPRCRPRPNFAYELCARRIPDDALEGLDLSSWRVRAERRRAGEPRDARALRRAASRRFGFRARGDDAGLRPRRVLGGARLSAARPRAAHRPRGRAAPSSATDAPSRPAPKTRRRLAFVSVGTRAAGPRDPRRGRRGASVGERAVGRLVFRGPSMTPGYYRKPGSHRRHHARGRLARQRRPRVPRGRRDLRRADAART